MVDLVSCLTVFIDGVSRSEAILGGHYLSRRAVVFTPDKRRLCQLVGGCSTKLVNWWCDVVKIRTMADGSINIMREQFFVQS